MKRKFKRSKRRFKNPKERELMSEARNAFINFGVVCSAITKAESLEPLFKFQDDKGAWSMKEINKLYKIRDETPVMLEEVFVVAANTDKDTLMEKGVK